MAKIPYHGNRKKEKGLTLLEVVIALAVIIIISVAALSVSVYSTNALNIAGIKNFFVRETSNFANMFLSYNESDFSVALKATDSNITSYDSYQDVDIYYDSDYTYTTEANSVYHLSLVFSEGNTILTLNAYNKDNSNLYTRSVTK